MEVEVVPAGRTGRTANRGGVGKKDKEEERDEEEGQTAGKYAYVSLVVWLYGCMVANSLTYLVITT